MINGERIIETESGSKSKKTKILISVGPGDKRNAESFLKMGAMLGYVDKKTKLFVPRNINKSGAVFSRSRSRKNLKKKTIKSSEQFNAHNLKDQKLQNIRSPLTELERTKNSDPSLNFERFRSSSRKDIPFQRSFIAPEEESRLNKRNENNSALQRSKERIREYKNKFDYSKYSGSKKFMENRQDLYSKVTRNSVEQILRDKSRNKLFGEPGV